MASPRTMWSGSLSFGLLNIPLTIGKATEGQREDSLSEVCDHGDAEGVVRIDRTHRCPKCEGPPMHKVHAVEVGDGKFRKISDNEWNTIDDAGKGLTVEDVQPLSKLPMMFATGTYYCRHNDKAKVTPKAFKALTLSLAKERLGIVCKWNQKLCVIYVEAGVLVLRQIPFVNEIRPASSKEREHWKAEVTEREVERMGELLSTSRNPEGFKYGAHENERQKLRQNAIDRILMGIEEEPQPEEAEDVLDPFELINEAIEQAKENNASKERQTA